MSVINQALKDLQQRQQQSRGRVRSVYQPPQRARWPLGVAIVAGVLAGGAAMYYMLAYAQSETDPVVEASQHSTAFDALDNTSPEQALPAEPVSVTPQTDPLPAAVEVPAVTPPVSEPGATEQQTTEQRTTEQPEAAPSVSEQDAPRPVAPLLVVQNSTQADEREPQPEQSSMRIERVERSAPELAQQRLEQAIAAQDSGNVRRAETLLQEALVLRPDFIEARQRLAAYYFGRGFSGQALRTIEEGLFHSPGHPRLLSLAARIHEEAGEPEAALDMLNRLNAELPEHSDLVVLRAALANDVSRYAVAAEDYRALLQMDANRGLWWLGLAFAEEGKNNLEAAQHAYFKALEDNSLNRESREFAHSRLEALQTW